MTNSIKQINTAYYASDSGQMSLQSSKEYQLGLLSDLHDTVMFYFIISLILAVWAILCAVRHYMEYSSSSKHIDSSNWSSWVLTVIIPLALIVGSIYFTVPLYLMDEVTDDYRIYVHEDQWYWQYQSDHSYQEERPEFDFSLSADNYHITDFEGVEELATKIRKLDREEISIKSDTDYTQRYLHSCFSTQAKEFDDVVNSNPISQSTLSAIAQLRVDALIAEIDIQDMEYNEAIIDRAWVTYNYFVDKTDILKHDMLITEDALQDISLMEQSLVYIKNEIDKLVDLHDELETCENQLAIKREEWNVIKDTLTYSDPYSFVYDATNETTEEYHNDIFIDYDTAVSGMDSFEDNNSSENWDQLPFHSLSSEQLERAVKTHQDVWSHYPDMGESMQNMFESSHTSNTNNDN